MNGGEQPELPRDDPASGDSQLDEGRRYWKAAIAHLAPEKREAAWEFYLDRLESSAAADTLGGVMLLLEAHLAFFDDLPARLVAAARQMENAVSSAGGSTAAAGAPPGVDPAGTNAGLVSSKRKLPPWAATVLSGVLGAVLASAGVFSFQHFRVDPAVPSRTEFQEVLFSRAHTISVEPWYDAATHRRRGCIVCFDRAGWTEQTLAGGAKVYVFSPVEEVRRDLDSLRQLAPSSAPKLP